MTTLTYGEYFIFADSFAAPFFSDSSTHFLKAVTPKEALETIARQYRHPCGLYVALCYESAEAYHKGKQPLARWLSNHEMARQIHMRNLKGYSYLGHSPGIFEINGHRIEIANPKDGHVLSEEEERLLNVAKEETP